MTLWQRLDLWARYGMPAALAILLLLVSILPLPVGGIGALSPWLGLVAVYYWTIQRPDLMPPAAAVGIGLLQDILAGLPLGVGALVLLLVQAIIESQRRFFLGKSFLVLWWGFLITAMCAYIAMWIGVSLYFGTLLGVLPMLGALFLTLVSFPLLAWLFAKAQAAFLSQV